MCVCAVYLEQCIGTKSTCNVVFCLSNSTGDVSVLPGSAG